jgi:hypothetical protein
MISMKSVSPFERAPRNEASLGNFFPVGLESPLKYTALRYVERCVEGRPKTKPFKLTLFLVGKSYRFGKT